MDQPDPTLPPEGTPLRRGWTTGACATAATRAALSALLGHGFPDPVAITLPGGQQPAFALAHEHLGEGFAEAGIIKDAGDDPDVTHGALVIARVTRGPAGAGISFHAGPGVGMVTLPGLPLAVGEPAINPVPRKLMTGVVEALCAEAGLAPDIAITISVPGGEKLAEKTWNPRLGILGGLSILGTTGIVVPYSCAAWIHSIQRGIDVARALGLTHIIGATGDLSEKAALAHLGLPLVAAIDMGDFVGGMLKYLRAHPVERVTIAGGFGKLTKLAAGALDLHSSRSGVDLDMLATLARSLGGGTDLVDAIRYGKSANMALIAADSAGLGLADAVAEKAREKARGVVGEKIVVDVLVIDRAGRIVGTSG